MENGECKSISSISPILKVQNRGTKRIACAPILKLCSHPLQSAMRRLGKLLPLCRRGVPCPPVL
uniref:Uncharacterized protein n=1 Tax=Aegilops tauschii subsp. strangulata TaxID=200361 RepID=A0A453NNF3_AEGTS